MNISIIIVNYRVRDRVIECLKSIIKYTKNLKYEVIVVDNEPDKVLEENLKTYKKVQYIKSPRNIGFGAGNNLGVKSAKGDYLFFLNPDTLVLEKTIENLLEFFKKNKNAGLVSPLILNREEKPILKQGFRELTPLRAIFSFSFLRKLLPDRGIFENLDLGYWKDSPIKEVDAIFGSAMMVSKKLFEKLGGFDERFFLYFEENDLSKRAKDAGFKNYIDSNSRVIHFVGQSTKNFRERDRVFAKSRYMYLKKHFGFFEALLTESLIRVNKTSLLIFLALVVGAYLRFLNINHAMQFIGDQGWFYLSARDMLVYGKIPLVGITSSHTWLHQGPLWTYFLAAALWVFNFNPISGAYIPIILGIASIFLIYRFGSEMFSERIGVIASLLYSVSPLIVHFERIPFDPDIIPFFTILYFYGLYKWIKGGSSYFPFIFFFIAVLYNLELATFSLFYVFLLIFLYGFWKKKNFVLSVWNIKALLKSVILILIPMAPVIVYDFSHGFRQTVIFLGWTVYKPFSFLIHKPTGSFHDKLIGMVTYFATNMEKLILGNNIYFALVIFALSIIYLLFRAKSGKNTSIVLLLLLDLVTLGGIVINFTPSDAYLPIIFPFVIFSLAMFFDYLLSLSKYSVIILILVLLINAGIAYSNDQANNFDKRLQAINKVIALTKGQPYNLLGKGQGSQFISFTMNYEYLLWWKGYPPTSDNVKTKILIEEKNTGIIVYKRIVNIR